MQRKRTLLFSLFLYIGIVLLSACGTHQSASATSGGDRAPSATATSLTKEGGPAPGKVTVMVGKTRYTPDETITVTVSNGLATSIAATNHQSGCTIVTLQWRDPQSNWQDQNRCRQGVLTRMITLAPHSSQVQALSPTSGTFAISGQWAKGSYRVIFSFTSGSAEVENDSVAGATGAPVSPIYSSTFTVA